MGLYRYAGSAARVLRNGRLYIADCRLNLRLFQASDSCDNDKVYYVAVPLCLAKKGELTRIQRVDDKR